MRAQLTTEVSRPARVGGGSTTSVGQLPIETKCPDSPANLSPPPVQSFHSPVILGWLRAADEFVSRPAFFRSFALTKCRRSTHRWKPRGFGRPIKVISVKFCF